MVIFIVYIINLRFLLIYFVIVLRQETLIVKWPHATNVSHLKLEILK